MSYTIAIAGKGGTGKTTIAGLILRLIREKKLGSILAVDADPNSNLGEVLGLMPQETVGSILDEISAHPEKIPAAMSKDSFIDYQIETNISEGAGFDLLSMGRPEGPGCYCYVNNVLRGIVAKLISKYDHTIIDNEAGLEHLSRRTTRSCDALIVVSDALPVGLRSAKRINDLVKELGIKTKKRLLIINRQTQDIKKEKLRDLDLDYIGNIPEDEAIIKTSLNGGSLLGIKDNSSSLSALRKIIDKILF